MEFNVDDIIAQHLDNDGNDNVDDGDLNLNVDDLLNDDLTTSVLTQSNNNQSPNPITDTTINDPQSSNNDNNHLNKPQLWSTLPPPIAPKTDESNVPDLPSTPSQRYSLSSTNTKTLTSNILTATEPELDIETILREEEDDLGQTNNDPLLDFDPLDIGIVCNYIWY